MKEKIKDLSKKWWFWVIIVIILVIGFSGGESSQEKTNSNSDSNNQVEQDVNNQIQETKKVVFLEETNSEDFAEVLEGVTGIENIEGVITGDSITYTSANDKYSINIDANKDTKEIDYVRIIALTDDDATNVFMSLNRMDYKTENTSEYTSWLVDNIGKEATTKIGDANFILSLSTSNHPILEMKTDGSNDYMNEQIDKVLGE